MNIDRTIDNFFKLVKIDSPTGEEERIKAFIADWFTNCGLAIKEDLYGNLYVRISGKKDTEPVFFCAHMDTVEPGRNIKPKINGQYIVSGGPTILGADNKATIACIFEAVLILREKKLDHRPLEIIFTRSEEIGNYGAVNFDYSLLKSKKGFCFDSSNPVGTIVTASPHYERFDLSLIGRAAHASRHSEAINALLILKDLLGTIKIGKLDEDTIFNVGVVNGGKVRNTIPGEITVKGEIRSLSQKKLSANKFFFEENIKKVIKQYKARYEIKFVKENPGYNFAGSRTTRYIDEVKKKITEAGLQAKTVVTWGVSDANIFNNRGLFCLNMGDGSEFSHSENERMKITEMENLVKLMLVLVSG
ncbi:M20/M25/M40 family metallo-hydrolase [Candidatus Roizmanbacteria bacterium]|jgi:tripeptide aminopeptidase|nr:M20/M25/M40 family metallo-hydrolase [Candidatus Roizmanbacteria bacterium]